VANAEFKVQPIDSAKALSILHLLQIQAEQRADATAVIAPERYPLSFRRLFLQAEETVRSLNALGIGRSDRVAVVLPNGPEMAAAFLAISSGATFAPLNPAYLTDEFEFCLSDLNAKALIVQSGTDSPALAAAKKYSIPVIELSPLDEAAGLFSLSGDPQASPHHDGFAESEDVALILYTSGTTAQPKMVPLTHANLLASAANIAATLRLTERDRCLNVMPLFHIHGLIGAVLSSVMAGSSVVCTPGFDPEKFFTWLEQFRPTWYTAVPTMHQAVLSCATQQKESLRHSSLRFIRSSSAALPLRVMQALAEIFRVPVIESYGMTEASHQIASNPLPPGTRKARSVGLPVGVEVAVMDDEGNLLDAGKTGEIVIRGKTVTSGYGNSPESNDENFKDGWFRTGDQGYWDKDGYLFITGRLKEIINRGGEKISPMEIDEVLKKHPSVLEAVTFPVPHPTLGQDISAAVVLRHRDTVTGEEIQRFAAARLAEFKIPRQVLIVNRIPKSAAGKIQRLGLPERLGLVTNSKDTDTTKGDLARPRTPLEEELSRIWSLVLGIQAGIHDNFFLLGGDSIQATRIISRVRGSSGVDLSFGTFFEAPTISAISQIVEAAQQKLRGEKALSLSTEEVGPLTYPQEALWFLDQLQPGDPAYNRPLFLRLEGKLQLAALERCLNEIIQRHAILRTVFPSQDGTPQQRITPYQPFSLPVLDIRALPESEQKAQARKLATEEARRSFDLARGPLIRCSLLRLKEDLHLVLVTMHHIVFDGWSVEIFLRELATLYQAFSAGLPSPLPALVVQYLDFARWQRELMNDERVKTHVEYWKRKLNGGIPLLSLPTDHSRPRIQTFNGASLSLRLSEDLSQALKAVSRQEEVTLFMMLLAAFKVVLCRYSGQEDIIVGTPVASRNHSMTEELIGLFINTLPLRTDLSGNPTFREFLARVRRTVVEAHAHQNIPFGKIVAGLKISRNANRAAVHQILFQLRNYPSYVGPLGELLMEEYEPETGTSLCDLSLTISEEKKGLECSFHYSTDLFEAYTIERMGAHFQKLLEGIVDDPSLKLSDLP
jgi:acyl-CoA synthetase (AMP-forming)/AMP-acid ligase II/aryl carrier-like protein